MVVEAEVAELRAQVAALGHGGALGFPAADRMLNELLPEVLAA